MNNLTKALMEELTVEYVKVGPLQIPESVVISWVILAIVTIGSILLTRNLKVDHISKRQAVLEMAYLAGTNFFEGLLGEKGRRYVPYLMTVAIYIAFSNLIGVFGVKPPTKDLDVTAGADEHCADRGCRHPCTRRRWLPQESVCPHSGHDPYEHPRDRHPPHQPVHATVRQRAGRIRYHGADQARGARVRPGGVQPVF